MKIITVLGTRPEFIKLSLILKKFDATFGKNHIVVNTGQNFEYNLSGKFIEDLNIRNPDYNLGVKSADTFERIGLIIKGLGEVFAKENPDYLFVLGDTYSAFAAVVVAKHFREKHEKGVSVFHMEAGNRSFDKRVPEETNRIIIDNISDYNLCHSEKYKTYLNQEAVLKNVFVVGNPVFEVMNFFADKIQKSAILQTLKLNPKDYILATIHRNENVVTEKSLKNIISGLDSIAHKYNKIVIVSAHPKTKDKLKEFAIKASERIHFEEPLGFLDFQKLMENAFLVISDSGTVPEECCAKRIPNLILRKATERIEVLEHAGSILVGTEASGIEMGADVMLSSKLDWQIPPELQIKDVSNRVLSLVLMVINSDK